MNAKFTDRVITLILRAYPRAFRVRFAAEMLTAWRDQRTAARRGHAHLLLTTAFGLLRALPSAYADDRARARQLRRATPQQRTTPMSDILQDARLALRSLGKQPAFAAVVILTLALGIGANTAVFSVLNSVVLAPLPYADPDRIVRIYAGTRTNPNERQYLTGLDALDLRADSAAFESVGLLYTYRETGLDLTSGGAAQRLRVLQISADYFGTLGATPLQGRTFTRDEERATTRLVILSHAMWSNLLNRDANVVGRTIQLSGESYEVIGVMRAGFRDVAMDGADAWVPQNLQPGGSNHRSNSYLSAVARLAPGVTLAQAQERVDRLMARLSVESPNSNRDRTIQLVPLHDDVVGESSVAVYVLMGAAGLVLLIACLNVANLFLARSVAQARETAIRAALGARRSRLVVQRLTESVLVAIVGGVVGSFVAFAGVKALLVVSPESIARAEDVGFDPVLLAFALGATILTGILFGAAPAFRTARVDPADALHEGGRGNTGGNASRRARDVLVASQVAVALVLLVGAGVLVRSFVALQRVDLGFSAAQVATFEINLPTARYADPAQRAQLHHRTVEALRALPGVERVGAASWLPANGPYHTWGISYADAAGAEQSLGAQVRVVEGDFFGALGVPMMSGRSFSSSETAESDRAVVINSALATRAFGDRDPLGQTLRVNNDPPFRVIGVVGDVAYDARGARNEHVYLSHAQFAYNRNWSLTYVVSVNGSPGRIIAPARTALSSIDPALVLHRPHTMESVLSEHRARQEFTLVLMGLFAVVALSLAAVGIYGVLAYTVTQRTREIGVRMALGAHAAHVRRLVVSEGLLVAGFGMIAGLGAALWLSTFLRSLVFEVSPRDPVVFTAVVGVLAIVVALAAYMPARRATRIDPLEALRSD